jgi:hypothetical protein
LSPTLIIDAEALDDVLLNAKGRRLRRPSQGIYLTCLFSARSMSVSHLSAISMKKDLCSEVRAASANRMHSAALLRNWSKLGKSASISIHMATDRAFCPKNDCQIKLGQFAANWQFYKRVRRSG